MGTSVRKPNPINEIDLMRGGYVVSTLTGAFGQSLKETRLTAMLGYLVAIYPDPFLDLFGFRGLPRRVCLEMRHEEGRSDILIETSMGTGVIEAKVDATDPLLQSRRYPARWVALLTHRVAASKNSEVRYVKWQQLAHLLERLSRSGPAKVRLFSDDLLKYLQVHHMAKDRASVEIYAREINEPVTLALFLQAQFYGCDYQADSRLMHALYFAPHFGKSITEEHPGIKVGIGYVARIESVVNATTWKEVYAFTREQRGGAWWNRHRNLLEAIHRSWNWPQHRSLLLLGKPRLAFNPPVRKESLQKGRGWLSKRYFSFDELFTAWGQ